MFHLDYFWGYARGANQERACNVNVAKRCNYSRYSSDANCIIPELPNNASGTSNQFHLLNLHGMTGL